MSEVSVLFVEYIRRGRQAAYILLLVSSTSWAVLAWRQHALPSIRKLITIEDVLALATQQIIAIRLDLFHRRIVTSIKDSFTNVR